MRYPILHTLAPLLLAGFLLADCGDDRIPTSPSTPATPSTAQSPARPGGAPALPHAALADEAGSPSDAQGFTREFHLERCTFAATGRNPYFILVPGYTQVFEGNPDGVATRLTIRVTDKTERVGGVTTRVVEERQVENGELVEVSRNFFAICAPNDGVFYFGEATDLIEHGRVVSHEGSWRAGEHGAQAGLVMPGLPLLGSRYFQEVAQGVAMDQAEIVDLEATVQTPLRHFTDALKTRETTPLEPGVVEFKWYVRDVGLVRDDQLLLVSAGFQ